MNSLAAFKSLHSLCIILDSLLQASAFQTRSQMAQVLTEEMKVQKQFILE